MMSEVRYQRVALETSLKPFANDFTPEGIRNTCLHLWANWERLVERCQEICVLLWVGEGSDIYEWHGDMDEPITWAQSIGFCNYDRPGAFPQDVRHYRINRSVPYRDALPVIRYRDLKGIIQQLRDTAREKLGREILIGATVDPGPEFAESTFRFEKHPEILTPGGGVRMHMMHFITHHCSMNADPTRYAGFPDGIAAGTSFGTFLGRQFAAVRRDLGFDYIWLSNGLAYTHFPWGYRGELFEGERFASELAAEQREKTNQFWRDFRAACPDAPVEVRGTNFSVGMDIASDGCSHADIAAIGGLQRPPCNPPWGSRALGLEMVSFLSRISKSPTDRLCYRFYLNDPWFVSNAWYDYYNKEPFDIYVPMSASRMNDDAGVDAPTDLSLLTIDTHLGELLRDEANEVTPHFLLAAEDRADAPGPVTWVYPFDEYDRALKENPERLGRVFMHDWFICQAVNAGLPLNTVCSSDRFTALAAAGKLPDTIYVAPAPAVDWACGEAILRHVAAGGKALFYGPLEGASPALLGALGLTLADEGLEGDFRVELRLQTDRFAADPERPVGTDAALESIGCATSVDAEETPDPAERPLRHRAIVGGGGLRAECDWSDPDLRAVVEQDGRKRVYAVARARDEWRGGRLAWVRGTCCFNPTINSLEPTWDPAWLVRLPDDWPRRMLAELGLDIVQERHEEGTRPANVFIKRARGAWFFVGHKPDTSVRFWVRTADGAPAYAEHETPMVDGYAGECFGKTFHNEVRAFVKMPDGVVRCKEIAAAIGKRRHFSLENLRDATVTLYAEPRAIEKGTLEITSIIKGEDPVPCEVCGDRGAVVVRNYTGTLYVTW